MAEKSNPDGSGLDTKIEPAVVAARCYDITTSLNGSQVGDFDQLIIIGMAVRLALHLRGVPAVQYDLLKQVGLYLLKIPPTTLPAVLELLAEVEFVRIDKEGKTIRSVVPTVPFYEDLFSDVGDYSKSLTLTEPETLTIQMVNRLSLSPINKSSAYNWGAEKKLVDRIVKVGTSGGFLIERRARGRDIVVSPMYFPEHSDKFADLVAGAGSGRVARIISLLGTNQGWPLSLAQSTRRIGEEALSDDDLAVIIRLASDGFNPAPSIETTHHGKNFFIFSPRPGLPRMAPTKRPIYEAAMALVAAVRQGQLLPAGFAIRYPTALLRALREKKWLKANTEALEQYRALAVMRLGRLQSVGGNWYRFELIDTPENLEAVDMAIKLISGGQQAPAIEEEVVLSLKQGQEYIETLVSRQVLVKQETVQCDPDLKQEINDFLLGGIP